MSNSLAIYITLSLVVTVAIAQLLYLKLVIARENGVDEDSIDGLDTDWLCEPVQAWVGLEADEAEPVPAGDPVLVGA